MQVSPKGQTFEPGERWMLCCKHAGNPLSISIETRPGKLNKTVSLKLCMSISLIIRHIQAYSALLTARVSYNVSRT